MENRLVAARGCQEGGGARLRFPFRGCSGTSQRWMNNPATTRRTTDLDPWKWLCYVNFISIKKASKRELAKKGRRSKCSRLKPQEVFQELQPVRGGRCVAECQEKGLEFNVMPVGSDGGSEAGKWSGRI